MASNALDAVSPANYLATNPELLDATRAEAGANLVRGFNYWLEDVESALGGKKARHREIRGRPRCRGHARQGGAAQRAHRADPVRTGHTERVRRADPDRAGLDHEVLHSRSVAGQLAGAATSSPAGHTVFMLSWKNPNASDRNLGMDDYLRLGIDAAVAAVSSIVPGRPLHSVGYCIGGTLLSIAAARHAGESGWPLASMSLLAAQQDFSEPGELSVFITPDQLDMLEAVMERTGVLESEQMAAAFTLLRSRDLLWNPAVSTYLRGKRDTPNDLMAWNADGTRMPYRMHAEYLRRLYLNNALAKGEFEALGRRVDLARHHRADVRRRHRDRSRGAVAVGLQGARL